MGMYITRTYYLRLSLIHENEHDILYPHLIEMWNTKNDSLNFQVNTSVISRKETFKELIYNIP